MALVVTVTLMAFLVMLLVGLAVLVRVESAVADTALQQTQARQNALMALNVAVGQLQRYAGPDTRVTATGNQADAGVENPWFTGVWDTAVAAGSAQTWFVSGNERSPMAVDPSTALQRTAANGALALVDAGQAGRVLLVGDGSARAESDAATGLTDGRVMVPAVALEAPVPGWSGGATVGRFAYWVGDEGVKAPLVDRARFDGVTYPPFDTVEARARLGQRLAADSGPVEFEPRARGNVGLMGRVLALDQVGLLAFLSGASETGEEILRRRFHEWSVESHAVIANTRVEADPARRGLRTDLSEVPETLGDAFAAYADFGSYMEAVEGSTAGSPTAVPALTRESMRRRYRITPATVDQGWQHGVRPVFTSFILQFNIRSAGGAAVPELEVRSRFLTGLWNPYSSALVWEPLVFEVEGLPVVTANGSSTSGGITTSSSVDIPLQDLLGGGPGAPMRINLPITEANPALAGDPDDRSWLPGRLYYWRTAGGSAGNWNAEFYNRTLAVSNSMIWTVPAGSLTHAPIQNSSQLSLDGPAATLRLTLKRASDDAVLAVYTSPAFDAFSVPARPFGSNSEYRITFPFRLAESFDTVASDPSLWLTTPGLDPRERDLGVGNYLPFASGGLDPAAAVYVGTPPISAPDRLLDRVMGTSGMSFNEDVPLFELPRQALLSLAELQHLARPGERPFAMGNPWASAETLALFDQTYFSGLAGGVTPDLSVREPLPNPWLRPLATKPDGTAVALTDLQDPGAPGLAARYLLQGAAFNVNSVSAAAWRAVLRGVRFPVDQPFRYVDSTGSSGAPATDVAAGELVAPEAAFLRFPQSAQETYKASLPVGGVTYAATTNVPPAAPAAASLANTHFFRQGLRVLDAAELDRLADAIAEGVRARAALTGPFRSLGEFLGPVADAPFDGRSVIERAIEVAGLNTAVTEFSSQYLTQADVIGALAPRLFVRSDTFRVRTFGEVINPATGEAGARAWCEAVVQRMPDPQAAAGATPTVAEYREPPGNFGRRFQVVSFRWLTESEI